MRDLRKLTRIRIEIREEAAGIQDLIVHTAARVRRRVCVAETPYPSYFDLGLGKVSRGDQTCNCWAY